MAMPSAIAAKFKFDHKIVSKILTNSESWLGLNQTHLDELQEFQDNFQRKVLAVTQTGSPKGTMKLVGQMLSMKWRII